MNFEITNKQEVKEDLLPSIGQLEKLPSGNTQVLECFQLGYSMNIFYYYQCLSLAYCNYIENSAIKKYILNFTILLLDIILFLHFQAAGKICIVYLESFLL